MDKAFPKTLPKREESEKIDDKHIITSSPIEAIAPTEHLRYNDTPEQTMDIQESMSWASKQKPNSSQMKINP